MLPSQSFYGLLGRPFGRAAVLAVFLGAGTSCSSAFTPRVATTTALPAFTSWSGTGPTGADPASYRRLLSVTLQGAGHIESPRMQGRALTPPRQRVPWESLLDLSGPMAQEREEPRDLRSQGRSPTGLGTNGPGRRQGPSHLRAGSQRALLPPEPGDATPGVPGAWESPGVDINVPDPYDAREEPEDNRWDLGDERFPPDRTSRFRRNGSDITAPDFRVREPAITIHDAPPWAMQRHRPSERDLR
jgi:hypothetical protein